MKNPHPKMITDEVSGIEVKNQRHIDWQAGAKAARAYIRSIGAKWPTKTVAQIIDVIEANE